MDEADVDSFHAVDKGISSVSVLRALPRPDRLLSMNLQMNRLRSLQGIGVFANLQALTVSANELTDMQAVDSLRSLTHLDLSCNRLRRVVGINALAHLQTLNLAMNEIDDVSALSGKDCRCAVRFLDISRNRLSSWHQLHPLAGLKHLEHLVVHSGDGHDDNTIPPAAVVSPEALLVIPSLRTVNAQVVQFDSAVPEMAVGVQARVEQPASYPLVTQHPDRTNNSTPAAPRKKRVSRGTCTSPISVHDGETNPADAKRIVELEGELAMVTKRADLAEKRAQAFQVQADAASARASQDSASLAKALETIHRLRREHQAESDATLREHTAVVEDLRNRLSQQTECVANERQLLATQLSDACGRVETVENRLAQVHAELTSSQTDTNFYRTQLEQCNVRFEEVSNRYALHTAWYDSVLSNSSPRGVSTSCSLTAMMANYALSTSDICVDRSLEYVALAVSAMQSLNVDHPSLRSHGCQTETEPGSYSVQIQTTGTSVLVATSQTEEDVVPLSKQRELEALLKSEHQRAQVLASEVDAVEAEAREKLGELRGRLSNRDRELDSMRESLAEVVNLVDTERDRLSVTTSREADLRVLVGQLTSRLESVVESRHQLSEHAETLTRRCAEAEADNRAIQQANDALTIEHQRCRKDLDELRQLRDQLRQLA